MSDGDNNDHNNNDIGVLETKMVVVAITTVVVKVIETIRPMRSLP